MIKHTNDEKIAKIKKTIQFYESGALKNPKTVLSIIKDIINNIPIEE